MYHTVAQVGENAKGRGIPVEIEGDPSGRRGITGVKNMRAAYIEQTGPPEVIKVGDLPRPEPGPGRCSSRSGPSR